MPYLINEGRLDVDYDEDASMNVISIPSEDDDELPLRLIITRDVLKSGEDLKSCLARQVRELSRQVQEFKEQPRASGWLGAGEACFPALILRTNFKKGGRRVFQTQCMAQVTREKLLILTLTNPTEFTEKQWARWLKLLSGFVPSPAFAPPPPQD